MASLFEQYDQARHDDGHPELSSNVAVAPQYGTGLGKRFEEIEPQSNEISSGFIKASIDPVPAMFQRTQIPIKFPSNITHLRLCSGFLIYVMENKMLKRVNLLTRDEQKDEIELNREEDVTDLFMDPSGNHVILVMRSHTNYYLHRLSKKPKQLSKFNGMTITAVAWNHDVNTLHSTGPILIGTRKGRIFETQFTSSDDAKFLAKLSSSSVETYCKQLYELDENMVSGIEFGQVNRLLGKDKDKEKRLSASPNYFIIVVTSGRLYQFFGSVATSMEGQSMFHSIFEKYKDIQDIQFVELAGDSGCSELHAYRKNGKTESFAWMAIPGVYYGNIDHTASSGRDSVLVNHRLIPYDGKRIQDMETPLSIVLTEFHILILFKDRLRVIGTLNEKQVWEDTFDSRDQLLGMWRDPVKSLIWVYAKRAVYKYKVTDESRDVWKILLDMGEFDKARAHCKGSPEKIDAIYRKQADSLFSEAKYDQSAIYYAQTRISFEEATLKFIEAKQEVALRTYLEKKLQAYTSNDKVQVTMLVTWLVELWLNQLGKLGDQMESDGFNHCKEEKEILEEEFRLFLGNKGIRTCLKENKSVIYGLIASHGNMADLVFFAELMEDYEKVISHRLQRNEFNHAIEQLTNKPDAQLVYKFSPLLMQHVPEATVDMWKTLSRGKDNFPPLKPAKLIPALVQYEMKKLQPGQHQAIRYLEFCIRELKNKEQAIHNYLISLYAEHDTAKLLQYLRVQGQDAENVNYDLKYALRLCSEKQLDLACVHIYSTMGLYSEAVNLALTVDLNLARENANRPVDDEERKKLWLDIARHVVQKQKNIDEAMEVLKDCDLLKIEDILPFFPDFVTIDKFKEAITKSLAEYNEHINALKDDMQEATESAEEIRAQIQEFRKKCGSIRTTDKCSICDFSLMTRSFYLFPCQHKFHSDCLVAKVIPNLPAYMKHRIEELQRKVASREDSYSVTSAGSTSFSHLNAKAELDELVAAECIFCGEQIIRTIDEPFILPGDEDGDESWL